MLDTDRRFAVTASFGQTWPGLAPNRATTTNPDQLAGESAQEFLADHPKVRLGLVAAASGAGALAVVGWADPSNYDNDTAKFSTVVCDWEQSTGSAPESSRSGFPGCTSVSMHRLRARVRLSW
ncbi:hypothetical protein ACIPK5_18785 [Streptomyces sp. NPDC086843]|uniref:hypothetical protein n=1 Tax=Streptomyces sp. NPDC086843 TaxID=3365763 RepID=UPI0038082895